MTLDKATDINRLTISSLIKKVEFIPQPELASGDLPIDYYIPTFDVPNQYESPGDSIRNDYLDLIEAPCAWELTTGDSNVLVGVADTEIMETHQDLQGKFEALLGDHNTGNKHGTEVAGLIAGKTDNVNGTASIGWNTKMVSTPYWSSYIGVRDIAKWSHEHNDRVRVINMSWAYKKESKKKNYTILKRFYNCISDEYNILLVAAGGNKKQCGNPGNDNSFDYYCYPASFESVVSVTAVGSRYPNTSNADSLMQDVLYWNNGEYQGRHLNHMNLNDSIDIAAPGYNLYRPTKKANNLNNTYTKYGRGTSAAAPIVSGTAALMFAINPNLTPKKAKRILKITADQIDTIPQNTEYLPAITGLGRLNAYRAVKMAKYFDEYGYDFDSMPKRVDLMVRDNEEDIGEEPNETTEIFWNSPDIWVRNQPDGIEEYQNVEYDPNGQSYVYVRVKNIGCDPTSENDELKLYWTKAASSMSWPEDYMGGEYLQPGNALKGDTIGTVNIPSIKPGEETILELPWSNVPDPEDYELINDQPWHYCLLARIESDDDPMTTVETSSIRYNDEHNNNIASKNLTVVNLNPNTIGEDLGGGFGFPNPLETTGHFDLELTPDDAETDRAIFNEAEVWVTLDEDLITAWEAGGKQSTDLVRRRDGLFLVTGENAALENIKLNPGEFGVVQLQFNFLTKKITEKETYLYHAIQRNRGEQ